MFTLCDNYTLKIYNSIRYEKLIPIEIFAGTAYSSEKL